MSCLTVLAGPTAVGKGTVVAYIKEFYPQIWFSVSATTRLPRPQEIDGVHYHFLSETEFDRLLASGQFLEWAIVHGKNRYGTLRSEVVKALAAGKKAILEIDLQGARQVRKNMPEAKFVFLAPPSWDELVRRLVTRGTESIAQRSKRLETAKLELSAAAEFDYVIVNDEVSTASEKLVSFMGE